LRNTLFLRKNHAKKTPENRKNLRQTSEKREKTLDRWRKKYYYYTARKQKLPLLTLVAMRGRVNKSVFQETGVR
jgi:hypothetical protein